MAVAFSPQPRKKQLMPTENLGGRGKPILP